MRPLFTVETARLAGLKSAQVRKQRKEDLANAPLKPVAQAVANTELNDLFSATLACACDETLERLRKTSKPMERAQLARALRDLRETWHLATGKPKPGQLKPDAQATRRPAMPRVYPSVYGPGPDEGKPSNPSS